MGIQVTASKTPLLLACSRPFDPETETTKEDASEPMRYGSALHECLELGREADVAAIAAKWGGDISATELHAHAIRTMACLKKWLDGDNIFQEKFTVVGRETHRATLILKGGATATRECDFDADNHVYDLLPGEFGGTDDLVAESRAYQNEEGVSVVRRVVVDYKSGDWGDFHKPSEMPQMLTLALQTKADAAAILHSPRAGVPVMYVDPVTPEELALFARRIKSAMRRIGDGSLRPGAWCARCSALEGCPAQDGALLKKANALIRVAVSSEEMARPLDKGAFHAFLQELNRLSTRAREVLRNDVRAGEIIVRPDGSVLVLRETEYETLSKSSIVRALGKQKGERLIEDLRKKGCVEKGSREELRAVKE